MKIPTDSHGLRYPLIAAAALLVFTIARPVTAQLIYGQGSHLPAYGWQGHEGFNSASPPQPTPTTHGQGFYPSTSGSQGYSSSFNSLSPPEPLRMTDPQQYDAPSYRASSYEWQNDSPFNSVSFFQPAPASGGGQQPTGAASSTAASSTSRTRVRDASGNKQQTDSFTSNTFSFWNSHFYIDGVVDFPVPGRTKVAENNSAMPEDRVYFVYKHFHNTLNTTIGDGAGTTLALRDFSTNRYVVGMEKTFRDGMWSVELRVPVTSTLGEAFDQGLSGDLGGIGNPSMTFKRLVYESDTLAIATGLAVSLPLGQDARFTLGDEVFTLRNQSAHLLPFAMFVSAPNDVAFYRGAVQLDIPAMGNQFDVRDASVGAAVTDLGTVRDHTLLYAGLSAGFWVYRDPGPRGLTGVAAAVDLQYTGTVAEASNESGGTPYTQFTLGANDISVLNLSFGLYSRFGDRTTTYVGAVVPLGDGVNRFFDSEVQFSANYAY